jgi:acetoin utilization deacetylase AcuC-like enzyme
MKIFYSPECLNYSQPGHPESPARARKTYELLEQRGYEFFEPKPCTEQDIFRAHSQDLLEKVKKRTFFDFDTPAFPNIFEIAILSAGSAIDAAFHCMNEGEKAFSLMRPPGHHATKNVLGGFCYFNNIAIACLKAREEQEGIERVAIVDFDCHHGNGTEDIMLGREGFLYLSLHQSPLYPGTGLKSRDNCINYPIAAGTSPEDYLAIFEEGIAKVKAFSPDLLAISAGFDSYVEDPITNLRLELETFGRIGEILAGIGVPTFAVLEGGYSRDLPECVYRFLQGLEG